MVKNSFNECYRNDRKPSYSIYSVIALSPGMIGGLKPTNQNIKPKFWTYFCTSRAIEKIATT